MQSIAENRPAYTQGQHGLVSGDGASTEDHTWLLNPGTQTSPGLKEFKNLSAIKQRRFTKTELEMDTKIKENKAKLQKKLKNLEEKLRENNLREPADNLDGERASKERAGTRSKRLELQGRGPVRDADMMGMPGKRQDVNIDEKEVVEYLQLQRKEDKIPKIKFHGQKIAGELHLQRAESAKRLIRGKGRDGESRENTISELHNCEVKDKHVDHKPKRAQMSHHDGVRGPGGETEEPLLPSVWNPQPRITDEIPEDFQLLPCTVCNRRFESKRLEAHFRVCRKVSTSQRPIYDGKRHRTKGTDLEQFLRTHSGAEPTKGLKNKRPRQTGTLHSGSS